MAVEWYFPTPIFVHNFEGSELETIQTELELAMPNILQKMHESPWGDNVTTTFEHKGKNDIVDFNLNKFQSAIMSAANHYALVLGYSNPDFRLEESWFNVCKNGQFQYDHTHTTSRISGCYYFSTNEDDGEIRFANPNPAIHIRCFPADRVDVEAVTYKPKIGRLLLFPGWLTHRVNINRSNSERISLAFNLS